MRYSGDYHLCLKSDTMGLACDALQYSRFCPEIDVHKVHRQIHCVQGIVNLPWAPAGFFPGDKANSLKAHFFLKKVDDLFK